jgi:hypothetical protein
MRNILGDKVEENRCAVEAPESVLGGRDILIDVRTSVVKPCLLPVLTYGCEIWGWTRLVAPTNYKF